MSTSVLLTSCSKYRKRSVLPFILHVVIVGDYGGKQGSQKYKKNSTVPRPVKILTYMAKTVNNKLYSKHNDLFIPTL